MKNWLERLEAWRKHAVVKITLGDIGWSFLALCVLAPVSCSQSTRVLAWVGLSAALCFIGKGVSAQFVKTRIVLSSVSLCFAVLCMALGLWVLIFFCRLEGARERETSLKDVVTVVDVWMCKGAAVLTHWNFTQNFVARCYTHGIGVEQNHKTAVKWYQKSAAQGDADAMWALGRAYAAGEGVEKDRVKAMQLHAESIGTSVKNEFKSIKEDLNTVKESFLDWWWWNKN